MKAVEYMEHVAKLMNSVRGTDANGNIVDYSSAVEKVCELIGKVEASGNQLMFIGNGASASFSSHMATDFWKAGGVKATAFNDSSLLTCIGNDYGYEFLFEKPIDMFASKGDILISISSSGKSPNIIKGIEAAKKMECTVITLSGFSEDNPSSQMGDMNFYVPDGRYGPVEIVHQAILHCILDIYIESKNKN